MLKKSHITINSPSVVRALIISSTLTEVDQTLADTASIEERIDFNQGACIEEPLIIDIDCGCHFSRLSQPLV